jgi:hypothetical protein
LYSNASLCILNSLSSLLTCDELSSKGMIVGSQPRCCRLADDCDGGRFPLDGSWRCCDVVVDPSLQRPAVCAICNTEMRDIVVKLILLQVAHEH